MKAKKFFLGHGVDVDLFVHPSYLLPLYHAPPPQVGEFEKAWLSFIKTNHKESTMGAIIANKMTITKEIDVHLSKLCDDFSKNFASASKK